MYSVTARIKSIKQPHGGYLPVRLFKHVELFRYNLLYPFSDENLPATTVGMCVDYLTRFAIGAPVTQAFSISLMGAKALDQYLSLGMDFGNPINIGILAANRRYDEDHGVRSFARGLLDSIQGLDDRSIINACKLTGFDVCFRVGPEKYQPVERIDPNRATIENIRSLVERSVNLLDWCGPIVKDCFTFEGGYTDIVSSGDGDYLAGDGLWDMKVSVNKPDSKHTLQLLMYWRMGLHSIHPEFQRVKRLGIINPRLNSVWVCDTDAISKDAITTVERDVIGYR